MTSSTYFAASRGKLSRAALHIAALEAEQAAYAQSDPLVAEIVESAENDLKGRVELDMHWKCAGLTPGLIVGDVVHNLRAALDLMASELARINDKDDGHIYFPFSVSSDTLEAAIKKKKFHLAGDDAIELLRKFAPYKGSNDALRALHDLDIQDKHTALIPNAVGGTVKGDLRIANIDGRIVKTLGVDTSNVNFTFPAGSVFAGDSIVEALENLVQVVDGIIEAFASMVALRSA